MLRVVHCSSSDSWNYTHGVRSTADLNHAQHDSPNLWQLHMKMGLLESIGTDHALWWHSENAFSISWWRNLPPFRWRGACSQLEDVASQKSKGGSSKCPFKAGDVVRGVVSARASRDGLASMDLYALDAEKKDESKSEDASPAEKAPPKSFGGFLPHIHLGDHPSTHKDTLASKLTPGVEFERLLVLRVNAGVPVVTMKPLLLEAAGATRHEQETEVRVPAFG